MLFSKAITKEKLFFINYLEKVFCFASGLAIFYWRKREIKLLFVSAGL